jgi:hypothetical protein
MSWVDYLVLRKDEKIVDSWQGIREIIGEPVEVAMEEKQKRNQKAYIKERRDGLLVLTNQRLLFLEQPEPNEKDLEESVMMSLIDVDKLWFEKAPLDKPETIDGFETHVFTLKQVGKKKEFNRFKKLVEDYCKKRKEELDKMTKKVDFNIL